MTTPEILSRLAKVEKIGERRWKALCPAHLERTPSLSLYENPQGDTIVHCFGCGAGVTQVSKALGLQVVDFFRDGKGAERPRELPRRIKPVPLEPEIDWGSWLKKNVDNEDKSAFTRACECLNIPEKFVRSIGGFWHTAHAALAFPMHHMKHGMPVIVGARLRSNDGKKWAVRGSHNGLFIPSTYPQDHLWIAEGPTDTACLLSLGFWAIGRASCSSGVPIVVDFVKAMNPKQITIVADKDMCGITGAKVLAGHLKTPTRITVPQLKDIRMWVERGATRAMVEQHAAKSLFKLWPKPMTMLP